MHVLIAHSDKKYTHKLKKSLLEKGLNEVLVFHSGFDALSHIIRNHNKVIIIEKNLPYLNASDIKKVLILKGIKSKIIIIEDKQHEFYKIYDALHFNLL